MNISLIAGLAQRLIAVCVAALVLWHVTHFGNPLHGKAMVYVPRNDVVLTIDNREYPHDSVEQPLVCDLEAGEHVLRVITGQVMLAELEFTVEPEKEVLVVPRIRARPSTSSTSPKRDPQMARHARLAIRHRKSQPAQN